MQSETAADNPVDVLPLGLQGVGAVVGFHDIKPSTQSPVFMFALSEMDLSIFPDPVRLAATEMVETDFPSRRDELASQIGTEQLSVVLSSCSDVVVASRLLVSLGNIADAIALQPGQDSPLAIALNQATSIDHFGDCLSAARASSLSLAMRLLELAGGQEEVLDRIRSEQPWITEMRIDEAADGKNIGFARLLHLSDQLQDDPSQTAHGLGRILLKCLPQLDSVDIQALLPGGHPISISGYESGVSKLKRGHERAHIVTSWNQSAMAIAHSLVADSDTNRLATARPLLDELVEVTRGIITVLFRGRNPKVGEQLATLDTQRLELHEKAHQIRPSVISEQLGKSNIGEPTSLAGNNDLSSVITNITDNVLARIADADEHRRVAAMISDTLISRQLPKVRAES